MKNGASRADSKSSRGLRTGKIHTSKNSASEIRRALGVRPSEAKVASHALVVAARSTSTGRLLSTTKGKSGGAKGGAKSTKR